MNGIIALGGFEHVIRYCLRYIEILNCNGFTVYFRIRRTAGRKVVIVAAVARRLRVTRRGAVAEARRLEVLVEVGLEGERLMAFAAVVRLGCRVRLHVRAQIGPVGERLATMSASVRLLAGVRTHVALQKPRARERLAAHGAHVRQSVREQVHR